MIKLQKISVVIPTLGGEILKETIDKINSGSILPDEILICIPQNLSISSCIMGIKNVTIIHTPFRGQVAQRAIGFQTAKYEYVLQLDDDILVDYYCIESLLKKIQKLNFNAAISPSFVKSKTGNSVYKMPAYPKFLLTLYYWLMNGNDGYQPGKIDKAGSAVGVDPKAERSELIEVDWLPGGCVMHRRENLVLEDFWKRSGKAYYEDLVHSYLLKKNGIRLYIDKQAICKIEVIEKNSLTIYNFANDMYRDYLTRIFYMKKVDSFSIRMYTYYILQIFSYIYAKIIK